MLVPFASASPTVSFTLTGTAGTNGWFTSNVTIHWTVTEPQNVISTSGCEQAQLVSTEGTTSHTCIATFADGSSSATATLKIDKSLPTVPSGTAVRSPDSNGWYNNPVVVNFSSFRRRVRNRHLRGKLVQRPGLSNGTGDRHL